MSDVQKILVDLQNLENTAALPTQIKNILGDLPWNARFKNIEALSAEKIRISFYSDNLSLEHKSLIENFIYQNTSQYNQNIVVYFTKKNQQNVSEKKSVQQEHTQPSSQSHNTQTRTPSAKRNIPGVNRIIAVASGKGGVGKSTVSVNLALALHNQGYNVGILDADIYGPSVPTMLNVHTDPVVNANNKIVPPESFGLKIMSFGFFAPEETAVIWRGPMIMKALQQFFWDVEWGKLDFLVIDLPPGTGDAQLTLVQSIPISGAVIVTTPQNVALLDAVKGIALFEKTEVPILGLVENMSTFTCPSCHEETFIFGQGGAERVSGKFSIPILGHIPLVPEIRVASDIGEPLTSIKGHGIRHRFAEIAQKVVQNCVQA